MKSGAWSAARKCWKIPVMEGDYVGEERFGTVKGIAGGNFLVMGKDQRSALAGAEAAMKKITGMPGVITSFAGRYCGERLQGRVQQLPVPDAGKHQPSLLSDPQGQNPRFAGP